MALIADLMKDKMGGEKPMGMKPSASEPPALKPSMEDDDGGGLRAAEDFLAASKSGNAAGLLAAFKRMNAACASYEADEEE